MKKIYILFISLLITGYAHGQFEAGKQISPADHFVRGVFEAPGNVTRWHTQMQQDASLLTAAGRIKKPESYLVLKQRLDNYIDQLYDAASTQWVNNSMNEFLYNASGNYISAVYSAWNAPGSVFELQSRQEVGYNANGAIVTETFATWNSAGSSWDYSGKHEYTYNGDGNVTLKMFYTWNTAAGDWSIADKTEITYTAAKKVAREVSSHWDTGSGLWVNSMITENSYDAGDRLSLTTLSAWNLVSNLWENNSKTDFAYTTGDLLSLETTSLWEPVAGAWANDQKHEFTYDANGFLVLRVDYKWSTSIQQWLNQVKYEYTIDANMNLVLGLVHEWDGSAWVSREKDEYIYNNIYTNDQIIQPRYFEQVGYEPPHMLLGITSSYGNPLSLSAKRLFNYSAVEVNGISEQEALHAIVFPQPAKEEVTFSWGQTERFLDLQVFDCKGRNVLNQQTENNRSVQLAPLTPGIYFYRLSAKTGVLYTGKLSLQ